MYTDAGYVTENTLTQAEQKRHRVIRADASQSAQGRTIPMRFKLMSTSVKRFVPRANSARNAAALKIAIWEPSTIASSGAINVIAVLYKNNVRVPRVDGEL